jgi:hypothetical protein
MKKKTLTPNELWAMSDNCLILRAKLEGKIISDIIFLQKETIKKILKLVKITDRLKNIKKITQTKISI